MSIFRVYDLTHTDTNGFEMLRLLKREFGLATRAEALFFRECVLGFRVSAKLGTLRDCITRLEAELLQYQRILESARSPADFADLAIGEADLYRWLLLNLSEDARRFVQLHAGATFREAKEAAIQYYERVVLSEQQFKQGSTRSLSEFAYADEYKKGGHDSKPKRDPKESVCFKCNKKGHFARDGQNPPAQSSKPQGQSKGKGSAAGSVSHASKPSTPRGGKGKGKGKKGMRTAELTEAEQHGDQSEVVTDQTDQSEGGQEAGGDDEWSEAGDVNDELRLSAFVCSFQTVPGVFRPKTLDVFQGFVPSGPLFGFEILTASLDECEVFPESESEPESLGACLEFAESFFADEESRCLEFSVSGAVDLGIKHDSSSSSEQPVGRCSGLKCSDRGSQGLQVESSQSEGLPVVVAPCPCAAVSIDSRCRYFACVEERFFESLKERNSVVPAQANIDRYDASMQSLLLEFCPLCAPAVSASEGLAILLKSAKYRELTSRTECNTKGSVPMKFLFEHRSRPASSSRCVEPNAHLGKHRLRLLEPRIRCAGSPVLLSKGFLASSIEGVDLAEWWLVDSGASRSVLSKDYLDRYRVVKSRTLTQPMRFTTADGSHVDVSEEVVVSVELELFNRGELTKQKVQIRAMMSPVQHNLLSASQLCRVGWELRMAKGLCTLKLGHLVMHPVMWCSVPWVKVNLELAEDTQERGHSKARPVESKNGRSSVRGRRDRAVSFDDDSMDVDSDFT